MKAEKNVFLVYEDLDGSKHEVYYHTRKNARTINGYQQVFENSNVVDVAVRDLEMILKFQKSVLKVFNLRFNEVPLQADSPIHTLPIQLSNMFEKLNRKIKLREFITKNYNESQVMAFLSFIDPETLKSLEFQPLKSILTKIQIGEITKTEQWKNAEKLKSEFLHVTNLNVGDICHFSSVEFKTLSISGKQLDFLKKTVLRSSKFEDLYIESLWAGVDFFNENEELSDFWGPAFDSEYMSQWYYRMKDSEDRILQIKITQVFVKFDIIEMEDVPNRAIVCDYNEN
ncbi:hypothetical protein B9Z55_021222 [Caenorhabditis nigoni]|nr:hypothetical protein B9Z55_021222 [Caenorhabditis nigoni]